MVKSRETGGERARGGPVGFPLLALECAVLAGLLAASRKRAVRPVRWPVAFFAATGVAALVGGMVHGFFPDGGGWAAGLLWRLTLALIGLAAIALAKVALLTLDLDTRMGWVSPTLAALLFFYLAVIVLITQGFWVAVVVYLPPALLLLAVFTVDYVRRRLPTLAAGVAGVALSLVAAVVQGAGLSLHPVWANPNVLYHLIQAVGLFLVFLGMRAVAEPTSALR